MSGGPINNKSIHDPPPPPLGVSAPPPPAPLAVLRSRNSIIFQSINADSDEIEEEMRLLRLKNNTAVGGDAE